MLFGRWFFFAFENWFGAEEKIYSPFDCRIMFFFSFFIFTDGFHDHSNYIIYGLVESVHGKTWVRVDLYECAGPSGVDSRAQL